MAGNAEGEDFPQHTTVPVNREMSPSRGVIDASAFPREAILKFVGVFSEIVQDTRGPAHVATSHGVKEISRTGTGVLKMFT